MSDKYLQYDAENFIIEQKKFDSNLTAKTESMMALGNSYLGLRSVDEEVESFNKEDFLVNGIFNKDTEEEVPEIANLADLIQTPIFLDGSRLSLTKKDSYSKKLSIKDGVLTRKIKINRKNKRYEINFMRFVSQANRHLYLQKIEIKQISGAPTILTIKPTINGQTTNYGTQHFKEGFKRRTSFTSVKYFEETNFSNRFVVHNMFINAYLGNKKLSGGSDNFIVTMDKRQIGFKISEKISTKKQFTLEKIMSINTSIDEEKVLTKEQVIENGNKLFQHIQKTSYEIEYQKSLQAWKKVWEQFNVEIKGDSKDAKYDRMAFAFSIFHLNSFVPKKNSNLSVGAKGLSGEGYQGHCYWDTELFISPNYIFTKPEIARNLLEYRYKGINGARAKAKEIKERKQESNLEGAQFPWEMAWPTDGEVCPYWGQVNVVSGKQVPIASRRQEIHVSAVISYAIDWYYTATEDEDFMNKMGYEMVIDTAIFWSNRVEKQKNGTYEIKDVMGPNEYKGNIDNNAFTNALVIKNLELAWKYIEHLSKSKEGQETLVAINAKIPYEYNPKKFKKIIKKLKRQLPNEDGIIAENDKFLKLRRIDVTPFQLLGDAGKKLFSTKEGHKRLSSQIVKQADVVLLTFLLPEQFTKEIIKQNFEFYEPITTHDSSLSPTTYAIQAIELRKMELAYKLFKYSLNIDMGVNMTSCDKGIHAGANAAVWQSIVFGYGGMRYYNNKLHFNPILPKQWDGLKYDALYKKALIEVEVARDHFTISVANNKEVSVMIAGKAIKLTTKPQKFEVKNAY